MATNRCNQCGADLAPQWAACPYCGRPKIAPQPPTWSPPPPPPASSSFPKLGCGGTAVAALAVWWFFSWVGGLFGSDEPTAAPAPTPAPAVAPSTGPTELHIPAPAETSADLNAYINTTDGQLIIANRNDYDWTNVEITVNPGLWGGGWKYTAPILQAGQVYTVGLATFTKGDGERFNPWQYQVQNVAIHCDTQPNHGRGHWYGGF